MQDSEAPGASEPAGQDTVLTFRSVMSTELRVTLPVFVTTNV